MSAESNLIVSALEALEAGDQALAVEILLGALDDGPSERAFQCECGASFEWPGLIDAHRIGADHELPHELEAAA